MADIDNFKKINDAFGHQIGDEVIIKIANIMKKSVRKSDIRARWGGEEFLILLPETDILGAETIAEKIRQTVEATHCETPEKEALRFTISLGVSRVVFSEDHSLEEAISRADAALYEAKRNGKNRRYAIVK
jgi:diguanylate cyclase (GGDEF)-like protein